MPKSHTQTIQIAPNVSVRSSGAVIQKSHKRCSVILKKLITVAAFSGLILFGEVLLAADIAPYEKTCSELGFKKKTPPFGNCVLLLLNAATKQKLELEESKLREQEVKRRELEATLGDGTPDHAKCFRSGLIPGTALYEDCRKSIVEEKAAAEAATVRAAKEQAAAEEAKRRNETLQREAAELAAARQQDEAERAARHSAQQQECRRMREALVSMENREQQQRRQEALAYARMTPQERASLGAYQAGQSLGDATRRLFGGRSELDRLRDSMRAAGC
jgi:hypothetical protein